ncbi:sulfite exporter TauE/SafE family protein [Chitinophaga sp. GCM10012297]|uniref:Probable membrane transporter protein n=1 Tax=Chitinophaga chungangae TaxID=2821488 RepID=A0ABS3YAM7_9BACT|nr:sulfite exporter TauE/SafE family protein [Chitinophaga chungangae]MBO9151691.1 sulfite exporter TauE/SafE family protein [Chitinophaga chungangae]
MTEILLLCLVAFGAGFIDAIVGGGGLLQTPALMVILPQYPVATLLGTTKLPSMSGTAFAAWRYTRHVRLNWRLVAFVAMLAFSGALLGAYCVTLIDNSITKPVIFFVLLGVAAYTYFNKTFGQPTGREHSTNTQLLLGLLFGFIIGFYDGLIGPGAGTFFILMFITCMGYDFLHASASAKLINISTNLAALCFFGSTGHVLLQFAIPMAVCNVAGAYFGTRLALLRGNKFIRLFFLGVVLATMLRFAWDIYRLYFK